MHGILGALAIALLSPITAQDAPDLRVSIGRGADRILPGETRTIGIGVGTGSVAHDVRVTLNATGGATIAGIMPPAGFTCNGAVCTAATFGPQSGSFKASLVAPNRNDGGTIGLEADISSTDEDVNPANNHASSALALWAQFFVDNTDDSGPGSLRQAMRDSASTAFTYPTRIVFRVPASATIHPRSPLPPLGGIVNIDATGQGVEIRGDLQPDGDGVNLDSICEARIRGLAINGFARNGVNIGHSLVCGGVEFPPVVIAGNAIGFNERGIGGSDTDTIWISGNEIGNNRRSGIFLTGGRVVDISENFIGVTRDGAPAPNGASGIYVSLFSASITGNVIANNTDFGIAVSALAPAIGIRHNRIFDNGHTAIDVGLDLESPNGDDAHRAMLNHPVLVDARYDPVTDKTIVRGRYDTERNNGDVALEFFASTALNARGHAEAQRFLGELKIFTSRDFSFSADGDLTGQWIAATATMEDSLTVVRDVTSELSAAVRVSR
jgi:hypothetical protein